MTLTQATEATIFRDKQTGLYSFGNGIRPAEEVDQERFEFVYRFLGQHVKLKVDKLLEQPHDSPNVQQGLKTLFSHRNI